MAVSKPDSSKTEAMFSAITAHYDLCNHLFSFGLDFYWRKKTASLCCNKPIETALDLCCGTGDMTFALADTGQVKTIVACDISLPMLDCAKRKYTQRMDKGKRGLVRSANRQVVPVPAFRWFHCPAENTGLPDASFDLITCAFGLRNVDDIPQTLKEMHRLLRPAGMVCILEFFLPQNKFLRSIYLFYLCRLMPVVAGWFAGSAAPWRYLADSIKQWEKIDFSQLLQAAGFRNIAIHPMTFNTIRITTADKCGPCLQRGSSVPA